MNNLEIITHIVEEKCIPSLSVTCEQAYRNGSSRALYLVLTLEQWYSKRATHLLDTSNFLDRQQHGIISTVLHASPTVLNVLVLGS